MNNSEEDRWTVYKASQYLPAVLSDPNKGKQSNFFTRTWGDSFVEKTEIEKSPFLPEITYAHFEQYLRKYGRRHKRHQRLSQTKLEDSIKPKVKSEVPSSQDKLSIIPRIYMHNNFNLNDPKIFNEVFEYKSKTEHDLQEELSHYLDIVEEQIAKQVSQKSGAFFHAMTSHDTIMEQMGVATNEVRILRSKVQSVDKSLTTDALRLLASARAKKNHTVLVDKLKLMSTVLQTQPTLQLLLSSSDYVGALELISGTQEVLVKELAGVTSLRHLPSQLKEMSKLIDKMLSTEFERYAAADLHRPLNTNEGVLEQERLVSLVAGLLRQSHLQFLEIYKQEAVTAAQALLKQLMIEQLADAEDELNELTGSGEVAPTMDSAHWLKVLNLGSEALGKLVYRVKAVHDIIKETADVSAGLVQNPDISPGIDHFLSEEDHGQVTNKLKILLTSVCDYCNERLAALVSTQSDKNNITAHQVADLAKIVEEFTNLCEEICGRPSAALKASFKIQAGNYVHKFNHQRKSKLALLLDAERWKSAEVPTEIQILVDKLALGDIIKSLPGTPTEEEMTNKYMSKSLPALKVGSQEYVTVGTVLILIRLVSEYCVCAYDLQLLSPIIGRNLSDLLRTFNSRSCQLVLGAGALRTAGLKTITSTNLSLASRSLQLVLWMIPHVRNHFQALSGENLSGFDSVEKDIGHHIQQLESKVLSIMNTLLGDQLNEWEAKPPVPSKQFRNISRHLTKLHEAVSCVLPEEQVNDMYQEIHKNFKTRIREQILKMNIQNNGGPQHGVVTTEIIFYLQTMKMIGVLPEKFVSDNAMDDIWDSFGSTGMIYDDKMDEDREKMFENRIIYSLPVRLGLWNEDLALQEEKNDITAYKRDHCQMLIQKVKKMMRNILKQTTLAIETAFVQYGQNYQIKTSDLTKDLKFTSSSKGLYLSGLITEKEIDTCQHFTHGNMMTASPIKNSFIRNTFTLVGCSGNRKNDRVVYGEDLMIQISESEGPPLYVQCENSTIDTFGHHLSLRLSQVPDFYCRFKFLHWDPQKRAKTLGTSFIPDIRVIVQHSASGQNLAVETTTWFPTFFGPECTVSCHTYRDTHKMETAENFWMLCSEAKVQTNLFVRAAKGEDIPTDIFD